MNLGGPSYKKCLKHQAGYTNEPGVWKPLSLAHLSLLQTFNSLPVLKTDKLIAYPCCLANDRTALKPAIEFDERLKENVGLTRNLTTDLVKNNLQPTTSFLKENLVTEAIVSSLTSLENKCSLPCYRVRNKSRKDCRILQGNVRKPSANPADMRGLSEEISRHKAHSRALL